MPELDIFVPFPGGLPTNGTDFVLYSTRPFKTASDGRPRDIGPIQSGERAMKFIYGDLLVDQTGVIKQQMWDPGTAAWVTVNGTGDAITANTPLAIKAPIVGGDFQIVLNCATAPTFLKHPKKWRLSRVLV
jgi:hypothetical protein